jgi:hypothetical protein
MVHLLLANPFQFHYQSLLGISIQAGKGYNISVNGRLSLEFFVFITTTIFTHYSFINLSLCSGVAVMFNVKPDSPSRVTSSMPPGIFAIPVSLPTDWHPHSTHIITYRRCRGLSHLVTTYLLLEKLALDQMRIERRSKLVHRLSLGL